LLLILLHIQLSCCLCTQHPAFILSCVPDQITLKLNQFVIMLKTLISGFALYSTVSGQAAFPAVDPPAVAPANPVAPVAPAIPVAPAPPAIVPIIPPAPSPGSGTPGFLNCELPCTDTANCPSTCAQQIRTVENPGNSFTMECVAKGACAQSQFTFTYTGGMTKYLESIKAGAPYAMYGSTFTIDNSARGTNLVVRTIECGGGLCSGATFRFLNADYGDIKCEEYVGCGAGCMVEMPPDAPVPCDQVSTT